MQNSVPHIHRINISPGGVPKVPIAEASVGILGIAGDEQRYLRFHGGLQRAVCLYALELIERLNREGHPIYPGSAGENITTAGLDWNQLVPGLQLKLGDQATLEITSYTVPCKTIADSFSDKNFKRISQKLHPGESRIYARVVAEGRIKTGDGIVIL